MRDHEALGVAAHEAIVRVFPVDEVPAWADLQAEHCPECAEIAGIFSGRPWPDVVLEISDELAVSLMTPAAFRYYLPALMIRCIRGGTGGGLLTDAVVGALSPPRGSHAKDLPSHGLTSDQVSAVLAFLKWREAAAKLEWANPEWSEEAIESVPTGAVLRRAIDYWTKRCPSGAA
jgi:hypothetical protein